MTMKTNKFFLGMAPVAAMMFFCAAGCDKGSSLAEMNAQQQQSRLYANAMDDLQAGRVDAAIRGFERVVIEDPLSYEAHFQLATLLQDVKKDYIGAIAHYRSYMKVRPESDKATVAQNRMKRSEDLLMAEAVRKIGGNTADKIVQENGQLTSDLAKLKARVNELEGALRAANKKVSDLTLELKKKSDVIEKLGEDDGPSNTANVSVKEALAELREAQAERRRRLVEPTDKELIEEDDETPGERIRNSPEIKNLRNEFAQEDAVKAPFGDAKPIVKKPAEKKAEKQQRPKTYQIQDGDTLYKISVRFYGNGGHWRAIREANRTTISPDGRLKIGQVINLP
jgi:nucleoid-associated protein YgaU